MRRAVLSILAVAGAVAAGCGSRGPLDDDALGATTDDAGVTPDAATTTPRPVLDAGRPEREAGAVSCGICVLESCTPAITSCLSNPQCTGIFQCVATTCLAPSLDGGGGGSNGLDTRCLLGCLGGNPAGAVAVLGIFSCLTNTCGPDCGPVLGGLGNLGGLGGLGGGGFGGIDRIDPDAFEQTFAPLLQER
ncbi:MAG: hypothetical protein KIT84_27895 [Labilithrix sp.]|nr:hypothetical protein [Labilithrix sp.]MCW5814883.1 hypothetical protein [Labilithrix sp.]